MNTTEAVLAAARSAGVDLAVDGTDLVMEASDPPPAAILDLLRARKGEIVAAITAASQEPDDTVVRSRDWYKERVAIRQLDGGYTREEAARLAWGEAQDRWHRAHGERISRDLCAGCRKPIGSAEALDLIDDNRVHIGSGTACLARHGERWRKVASRALDALGIRPRVAFD